MVWQGNMSWRRRNYGGRGWGREKKEIQSSQSVLQEPEKQFCVPQIVKEVTQVGQRRASLSQLKITPFHLCVSRHSGTESQFPQLWEKTHLSKTDLFLFSQGWGLCGFTVPSNYVCNGHFLLWAFTNSLEDLPFALQPFERQPYFSSLFSLLDQLDLDKTEDIK